MLRTGIDIIYIPRLAKQMENQGFLDRLLTPKEQERDDAMHLAGKIAAKEAFFKAINQPLDWLAIEVEYEDSGKPKLSLSEPYATQVADMDVSISHDEDYAVASVVLDWEGAL